MMRLRPAIWLMIVILILATLPCITMAAKADEPEYWMRVEEYRAHITWDGVVEVNIETPHPYPNNYYRQWTIEGPEGTTFLKIHFERIELERNYDYVYIYDENNQLVFKYSGRARDLWVMVQGRRARIVFRSDFSVRYWGFKIDKFMYSRSSAAYYAESPHPYPNNYYREWIIRGPEGAYAIQVFFERIDLERNYDYLYVYDGSGNLVAKYTGSYTNVWLSLIHI